MSILAACIDVTGGRAMDVAYVRDGRLLLTTNADVLPFCRWVAQNQISIVAIDAPSKRNCGRVALSRDEYKIPADKYEDFRLCEAILRLRGIGLYNTSRDKQPEWVERGWELYESLGPFGYRLLDDPGVASASLSGRTLIEVHPHASFVVGLGRIPQTKQNLAGQLERVAFLRHECERLQIDYSDTFLSNDMLAAIRSLDVTWDQVRSDGIDLPDICHDCLDATVGLITALRAIRGEAYAVGHKSDGVIVLPKELAPEPYRLRGAA